MATQIQIIKHGIETWEVTRVDEPWPNVFEYWQDISFAWHRPEQKGFSLPRGAFRALIDREKKAS